jgi:hypothetical protein
MLGQALVTYREVARLCWSSRNGQIQDVVWLVPPMVSVAGLSEPFEPPEIKAHTPAPRTLSPGGDSFVTIAHAGLADGVLARKADVTESEESGRGSPAALARNADSVRWIAGLAGCAVACRSAGYGSCALLDW